MNEEAEKLSIEEKNINQNNNGNELNMINQETKIDVTPPNDNQLPNRKFHFTMSNHNLHQMQMRQQMNSEMVGMNHPYVYQQHQHQHQHQHDFSNPKYLYNYIKNLLKYANYKIQHTFSSLTNY